MTIEQALPPPLRGTQALRDFASSVTDVSHLGTLLQILPHVVQELGAVAPHADQLRHLERHKFRGWHIINSPGAYVRITDEMVFGRVVDRFRQYLATLLLECAEGDPAILAEFEHRNCRAISLGLEERLAKGIAAVTAYLVEKLGSPFYLEGDAYQDAVTAIAVRNGIVYNAGDLDDDLLAQIGHRVGEPFTVDTGDVLRWIDAIWAVAVEIDDVFVRRFGLRVVDITARCSEQALH